MNTFTRKSLYAALAGVGALGVTGAAQAVNVNPNGLGQVLLYPYYTVRTDNLGNPYNSLLSIVNSTASVKAATPSGAGGFSAAPLLPGSTPRSLPSSMPAKAATSIVTRRRSATA